MKLADNVWINVANVTSAHIEENEGQRVLVVSFVGGGNMRLVEGGDNDIDRAARGIARLLDGPMKRRVRNAA